MSYRNTILLTGGSSGIGLWGADFIAKALPQTLVVIVSRTPPPPKRILPSNVLYTKLDLLDRGSIRSFVSSWSYPPLKSLIFNAALFPGGGPVSFSPDGVETAMAVNVGHSLLFFLLKDKATFEPDCRIIFLSSGMHDPNKRGSPAAPDWIDAKTNAAGSTEKSKDGAVRYASSKLGVNLFALALMKRLEKVGKRWTVNIYEPGFTPGNGSKLSRGAPPFAQWVVNNFINKMTWLFNLMGVTASTPPRSGKAMEDMVVNPKYDSISGRYIEIYTDKPMSAASYDVALQEDLWEWTVNEVALDSEEKRKFEIY